MTEPLWMWVAFATIVLFLLVLDLGVFRRNTREISIKESLYYSAGYILVALLYCVAVYYFVGEQQGEDFLTGYLVEKSLSLDNIFVISLTFKHFQIPRHLEHRVLVFGIMGVLVLRGLMIGLGATLIEHFHPVLYFFGGFLLFTGLRMLFLKEGEETTVEENKILLLLKRYINVTPTLHGSRFFVTEPDAANPKKKVRKATPLFIALVFIELADAIFAMDSVPAIFSITTDAYVVFTSNVFAILGLRALYFTLSVMLHRFAYLKHALALVLMFIGAKIFAPLLHMEIPSNVSLLITLGLLGGGVVFSLFKTKDLPKPPHHG